MINKELREFLKDAYPDAVLFDNPSFDNSIIGISDDRLVYNMDLMIEELAKDDDINVIEALEFIEYNTMRALPYVENAPIVMESFDGRI